MSELSRRIELLADAIERSAEAVEKDGRNALSTFDNLRRQCENIKYWSKHVDCAAMQGARVELSEDGDTVYCRPD